MRTAPRNCRAWQKRRDKIKERIPRTGRQNMKNRTISILIAGSLAAALILTEALAEKDVKKESRRMNTFMRQKLSYSQLVLEGLTLEKYDLIIANGQKMWNMARENLWQQLFTEEYKQDSQKYRDNVFAMIEAAREKKVEEARNAFGKTLQSCYDCHKHFNIQERAKVSPKKTYE
jgi:cytochrome c556